MGVSITLQSTTFSANHSAKKTKNRGIILTNRGGKNVQNCINIHSNCINIQFFGGLLCTSMVITLHPNGRFFAWLPPLVFLEVKSPTFFFLILNELHSSAENFTFLTKTNYIPYENTLHSLREYTSFS